MIIKKADLLAVALQDGTMLCSVCWQDRGEDVVEFLTEEDFDEDKIYICDNPDCDNPRIA